LPVIFKYAYIPIFFGFSNIHVCTKKIKSILKKTNLISNTFVFTKKNHIHSKKGEKYSQIYMYVPRQNITYSDAVVKSVSPLDPFVDACLYKERERERETGCVC